ncbi:Flp/Fap pilin component [Roseibium sp. TrichSKD4]|uniref:Flp family type IVb pilin n=1 Tax=Roseibium sp. TrichSKD4 TaxID=744980 RepID=UPI0001E56BF7|nr:Flp family type IVb pilin [Roseibium sp. TrichSKD4]EFO33149.1 Flp/Fap pilin component [Roseibium sp. TrichSKD4]
MKNLLVRLLKDEAGTTSIEYALIGVLLSIIMIGAVTMMGTSLNSMFEGVESGLSIGSSS